MNKNISGNDLAYAYQIMYYPNIFVRDEFLLVDNNNPEKILLEKEKISLISKEALDLLKIIFDSPNEFRKAIDIRNFLKNKGTKERKIRKIMKEIKEYR